ncbi:Tc toxin subunit A [Pseudomonas chlororaphis]|uniref:Tc toxin subunit A n=1 Tax=Pseudomonas chlororaphis TaxID=587753 RepID=UPI003529D802
MNGDLEFFELSSKSQSSMNGVINLGYTSIFDIAAETQGAFIAKLSSVNKGDAKAIHTLATSRVRALEKLYRAFQARSNPMLRGIKSLQTQAQPEALSEALRRSLNGAPDFSKLFPPRSTLYAEAFSIQSLFSPGRYATELYKISKSLHAPTNPLNIDKRRPDIKTTVLNEKSLTQTLPDLEILNSILASGLSENNINLDETSYPWQLPYNDSLQTIRCIFSTIGLSVQRVWAELEDYQWHMFNPVDYKSPSPERYSIPSPYAREQLELMPGAYRLLVSEPATESQICNRYHLPSTPGGGDIFFMQSLEYFTDRTGLTFNQVLDMTSQLSYQHTAWLDHLESRYFFYQRANPEPLTEYGLTYQSAGNAELVLMIIPNINDMTTYNMSLQSRNDWATIQLDRVERFIRLQRQVAIEYNQLDWLISSINKALSRSKSEYLVDTPVLDAIAEFSRLKTSYRVSADMFTCFIGEMNCYAEKYGTSMFESVFTSPASDITPPLNTYTTVDFRPTTSDKNAALIGGGLGVSQNELYTMAQLVFDDPAQADMWPITYAKLYRLANIPRMLGITFPIARIIWQLLDPGRDLAALIAQNQTLETLSIIRQTESVLSWMTEYKLDLTSAVAMLTNFYSSEPTPEIFNFLDNIYSTLNNDPKAAGYRSSEPMSNSLRNMLYQIIGGSFHLSPNVMSLLIAWLDMYFTADDTPYKLDDFWAEINQVFSTEEPLTPETLQSPNLVRYSNALAQHAMISRWTELTEQDLLLFINTPRRFFDEELEKAPRPSFPVLLMLKRLTTWQKQVETTEAEAFTYFSVANQQSQTAKGALTLLAVIQGWKVETTLQMNQELVDAGIYSDFPRTFQQLNRLETWMSADRKLQCGSRCVSQLYQMSLNDNAAENPELLRSVADALLAGTQSPLQLA